MFNEIQNLFIVCKKELKGEEVKRTLNIMK